MSAISQTPPLSASMQLPSSQIVFNLVARSKEREILHSFDLLLEKVRDAYAQFTTKQMGCEELYCVSYGEFFNQNPFFDLMDSFEELGGAFFAKVRQKLEGDPHSLRQTQSDQGGISDFLKNELLIYQNIFSQISDEISPLQLDFIEGQLKNSPFYSSMDQVLKKKLDLALAHLTRFCLNLDERVKQILNLDESKRRSRVCERKIQENQDVNLNRNLLNLFQRHIQQIKDGPIRLLNFSLCIDRAKKLLEELEGAVPTSEGYFLAELLLLINIYRIKISFERVYLVDQIKGLEFLSSFFEKRVGKENIIFEDLSLERRCTDMRSSFLLKQTLVCSRIFSQSFIEYPSSISTLTPKKFFRLTSYFQSFFELLQEPDTLVRNEKVEILCKEIIAFKDNELNLTENTLSIINSILRELDLIKGIDSPSKPIQIKKIEKLFSQAENSVQVIILDPLDHLVERIKKLSV